MVFALSRLAGHAVLAVFLCVLLFVTGCRSPESDEEQRTVPPTSPSTTQPAMPIRSAPPVPTPGALLEPPDQASSAAPTPPAISNRPANSPAKQSVLPLVALIIDDMGYHRQLGEMFLQLEADLTYSFLPDAPWSAELAALATRTGRDVLVHLPMEPRTKEISWEKTTLLTHDAPERIREQTLAMLTAIPQAIGANNHMGSRFTEDEKAMRVVIETLKERKLFFIDSSTSAQSLGLATARRFNLPTARRHVFLDNVKEVAAICRQLEVLADLAQNEGQAIGIGHPHPAMFSALRQCGSKALQPVTLVGVHRLVR